MAWLRYDDRFTAAPSWEGVSYAARWHYIALVEYAGATGRSDGTMPLTAARRASDVPDPDAALAELEQAGRVAIDGNLLRVTTAHEHLPPPYIRDNAEKTKLRMRRLRAHRAGDHSLCDEDRCSSVSSNVTRNTGTGRDGSGRVQTSAPVTGEGQTHAHTRENENGRPPCQVSDCPSPAAWRLSDGGVVCDAHQGATFGTAKPIAESP